MKIYEVKVHDLSGLGMQGSTSRLIDSKLFATLESAKTWCEVNYENRKNGGRFNWIRARGVWHSGDLGFIMYEIREQKVIK